MLVFWFQTLFRRRRRMVKVMKAKLSHEETLDKQIF